MTITLDLSPEIEEAFREIAARHGLEPGEYVQAVIQRIVGTATLTARPAQLTATGQVTPPGNARLLDFEGIGAHNPVGQDPQGYVHALRDEWAGRP